MAATEQISTQEGTEKIAARTLRRSYEAGHKPKFLVLVDEGEECRKAVYFACRRAFRVGAEVLLLRVIKPCLDEVALFGVAEIMRSDAQKEAEELLARSLDLARSLCGTSADTVVREGDAAREIFKLINGDRDIAMLVLAANSSPEGPGVLVSELGRTAGTYPVPVVIVPAHLTDAEIDALS